MRIASQVAARADGGRRSRWAFAVYPHYIDHLAPICELMDAPLVVPDATCAAAAGAMYPDLNVEQDRSWPRGSWIAEGMIFHSQLIGREMLRRRYGGRWPPRLVFCPHGVSEKRQRWAADAVKQDVVLQHGALERQQLEEWGVLGELGTAVPVGNLRYQYYTRHQSFFDGLVANLVDRTASRTLLYAPTWCDTIGSSSLPSLAHTLIGGLPADWHLVIKLHPHLEAEAAWVEEVMTAAGGRRRVTVARQSPLTYPWLAIADVYLGDMSSLAYDFLLFNRPMFFLNQTYGSPADASDSRLFQCGVRIDPPHYPQLFTIIEQHLADSDDRYAARRAALYADVYTPAVSWEQVGDSIERACVGPAPEWMINRSAW